MMERHHITQLFSLSFEWLCHRRQTHPPSSDIWDFKKSWRDQNKRLIDSFISGRYRVGLQKKIRLLNGETIAVWSSQDALIIKVLTMLLENKIRPLLSDSVYNIKGNGGSVNWK